MQINTSTLLSMLGSNVDNNIKQKIQNQSSDGKSNLTDLIKDKNIQTLLSDTFKNLANGVQSKNTVFETLQNSKQLFDLKSFSNDIKTLITSLESNPKTQKEAVVLKELLVNIKDLDGDALKSNLNNSGILLESKLGELSSVIKDPKVAKEVALQKAISDLLISAKSASKNSPDQEVLTKLKSDISNLTNLIGKLDIKTDVKTAINGILSNIDLSNFEALEKSPKQNELNQKLISQLNTFSKMDIFKESIPVTNLKKDINLLQSNTSLLLLEDTQKLQLSIKNNITNISNQLIKSDLPLEIKNAVNNLLQNIKITSVDQKIQNDSQLSNLNNLINKLENIDLGKIKQDHPLSKDIKSLISDLKLLVDKGSLESTISNIKQNITNIGNQVLKMELPIDIKKEINNIFSGFKSLDLDNALLSKDKMDQNIPKLNILVDQLKHVDESLSKISNPLSHTSSLLEELNIELKNISQNGIEAQSITHMKTVMTNLGHNITKGDIPLEVKNAINNLLSNIKNMGVDSKMNFPPNEIKQISQSIVNLQSHINSASISNPSNLNLSTDLKGVLLQLSEAIEKNDANIPKDLKPVVDKLLTQVEYYQALSFSSYSNFSYLPFEWDKVEEGDIKFSKKEDDGISCQINLALKEKGNINILLQLDKKKNILINMAVENLEFKKSIQENLQALRKGINNIGLNLQGLNVFDMIDHNKKGSNPYENKGQLNFGLDVKI